MNIVNLSIFQKIDNCIIQICSNIIVNCNMTERWEQPRKTKKDKARRNEELHGKFSPKHIRMGQALAEKRIATQNKYVDAHEVPAVSNKKK
jgi:hypothetical protein